jgi:hypothetical protein
MAANPSWSGDSDPKTAWKSKPISEWTEQDANQLLTSSPWSRRVAVSLMEVQGESQRRDGGNMGSPQGVGYEQIEDTKSKTKGDRNPIFVPAGTKDKDQAGATRPVQLRWETALPVRVAEMKAHSFEPPTLEGDGIVLAVYGIPGRYFKGTPESLGAPLRKLAVLKREGKKDIRPIRVEVFQREQDLVIAYMFPRTEQIKDDDKILHFECQIGRFLISQVFDLDEMRYKGKLEM